MKWNLCKTFLEIGMFSLVVAASSAGCGIEPMDSQSEAKPAAAEEVSVIESAVAYNRHDYLFVTTPKTWDEAQSYCQLAGDYSLVTINDASEESFLQTQQAHRGLYNWWIGAHDRGIEGSWTWVNGPSSYSNWLPGQPDDAGGNEDCAVDRFTNNVAYSEQWNDWPCSRAFPFVCERDSEPTSVDGGFYYFASNTSSATVNTHDYSLQLFAGQVFTVGTCGVLDVYGDYPVGDTYLRIYKGNTQIAQNDDTGGTCGLLSNISIVVPETGTYTIKAGCYGSGNCAAPVRFNY